MLKSKLSIFAILINSLIVTPVFADSATQLQALTESPQTQQCTTTYVNPYKTSNFNCSNIYNANSCNAGDVVVGVYSHGYSWWKDECQLECATPQKTCNWTSV